MQASSHLSHIAHLPKALAALLLLALAACGSDKLSGLNQGTKAPASRGYEDPDGLIVGHRLMSAGEYELALSAYYRAGAEQGLTVDVLSALGSANLKLGRLGQAEDLLRRAVKKDEKFPPAWNNLGVILMEKGNYGEAARVFKIAFALDSGNSAQIKKNLNLAMDRSKIPGYGVEEEQETNFDLVRRGSGEYLLLSTP
ncbi:tetratricopeptide repeat protein [Vannielia litorea]|nr:tetratricopeptide repeat protein [Vannielia litorea]